jgi:hypothetical protein
MDLGGWLRMLGLEQYEAAFRENDINERVLPSLTLADLKESASVLSATAESFCKLLLLYAATRKTTRTKRPAPQKSHLKTAQNAAKSQ